ncbi:MAG: sigma-54 interaction domain-containing protein [Phycisphaerales bacterium JB039]
MKELNCIYRVSDIADDRRRSFDEKMQAIAECLPPGWQYPQSAAACIRVRGREFATVGWDVGPADRRLQADILLDGRAEGWIAVAYADDVPVNGEVFLREEGVLIAEIARRIGALLAQRQGASDASEPEGQDSAPLAPTPARQGLIGASEQMQSVRRAIDRAARTSATVLICGESGTGKELVARAIHYQSRRSTAPFLPVNCAAIPESLVESELFGYVKGAFTGATTTRAGFFQTADGGTIFLDEISEMSLSVQAKLLRVLQDHEVRMVGSDRSRPTDVRIIVATNKDLASEVNAERFRADLYFRLNVLTIDLPSLRDRSEDLELLIEHFVEKWAHETSGAPLVFSSEAMAAMRGYDWPGNIRELENLIRRMGVMLDAPRVELADLPAHLQGAPARSSFSMRSLEDVEAEHIRRVLDAVDGNRTRAAEVLGIDRKTLRAKLASKRRAR